MSFPIEERTSCVLWYTESESIVTIYVSAFYNDYDRAKRGMFFYFLNVYGRSFWQYDPARIDPADRPVT